MLLVFFVCVAVEEVGDLRFFSLAVVVLVSVLFEFVTAVAVPALLLVVEDSFLEITEKKFFIVLGSLVAHFKLWRQTGDRSSSLNVVPPAIFRSF